MVKHGRSLVRVFRQDREDESDYTEQVLRIDNPLRVFVGGRSPRGGSGGNVGNTVLVHVKGTEYVYIGESIYSFKAVEAIKSYVSDVGNNDVPYAYALDGKYTYLLIGSPVRVPTSEVRPDAGGDDETPFDVYYAPSLEAVRQRSKGKRVPHMSNADAFNAANGGHAKVLRFKTIVPRLGWEST